MTALALLEDEPGSGRWRWPVVEKHFDRRLELTAAESAALRLLGETGLRRLDDRVPAESAWRDVDRLWRPLDELSAALHVSGTFHQRRAVRDAVAVLLGVEAGAVAGADRWRPDPVPAAGSGLGR